MAGAERDIDLLIRAVRVAGHIALKYRGGARHWTKGDGSPVSEADLAANASLQDILCGARPDYGWISEENERQGLDRTRAFVVDPIDGTRAYLTGQTEWSVVAAVLEGGRPISAAIYRPYVDTLYCAERGAGALRNGLRVRVSGRCQLSDASVSMPGPLYREGRFKAAGVSRAKHVPSLALRLAKVGDGGMDAVISKPGPHHWDLAAADLFVHEAGGTLTNLSGETLNYAAEQTSHGAVFAGTPELAHTLRRMASESSAPV